GGAGPQVWTREGRMKTTLPAGGLPEMHLVGVIGGGNSARTVVMVAGENEDRRPQGTLIRVVVVDAGPTETAISYRTCHADSGCLATARVIDAYLELEGRA